MLASHFFFHLIFISGKKLKPELRKFSIFILYSSNDSWRKLMRQKSMCTHLTITETEELQQKLKWWWNRWSYNASVTRSYCHYFKNFAAISLNSYINISLLVYRYCTCLYYYHIVLIVLLLIIFVRTYCFDNWVPEITTRQRSNMFCSKRWCSSGNLTF